LYVRIVPAASSYAVVVKLADALGLSPSGETRGGSNPSYRTNFIGG
jgi:hypothetical protein